MAFTRIVSVTAGSIGAGTVTSGNIDTTGVDFFVMVIGNEAAITVSDSKGNTWTNTNASAGNFPRVRTFYSVPTSVGTGHNFTVAGIAAQSFVLVGFSGGNASPLDQISAHNSTSTTTDQPGSIAPTEANELVIAGTTWGTPTGNDISSIDGGFTTEASVTFLSGNHYGAALSYLIQTTATAANPTSNVVSSSNEVSTNIVSFKAAAAGATGQPTMRRWGGTPYVGGHGIGTKGKGRMWGRTRSGLIIPRRFTEAA